MTEKTRGLNSDSMRENGKDIPSFESQPRKREFIPYLAILKIIGIIAVIVTHLASRLDVTGLGDLNQWVARWWLCASRFGPSIFVMVSGALVLRPGPRIDPFTFYRRKLPRLFIPLLFWSLVFYWAYRAAGGFSWLEFIDLFMTPSGSGIAGHFWFMYMIIALYLSAPFFHRMLAEMQGRDILWFLGLSLLFNPVAALLGRYLGLAWPFRPENTPFGGYIFYFIAGYYLVHAHRSRIRKKYALGLSGICFVISVAATFLLSRARHLSGAMDPFYFANVLQFNNIMAVFSVFIFIKNFPFESVGEHPMLPAISNAIFGIYLAHPFVMNGMRQLFEKSVLLRPFFQDALWGVSIGSLLIFAATYFLVAIGIKIPYFRRTLA